MLYINIFCCFRCCNAYMETTLFNEGSRRLDNPVYFNVLVVRFMS